MDMKRGVLRSFDPGTYTAGVQLVGSLSAWLTGVPVARNILAADLVAGRNVAVLIFDLGNPNDAVVAAVWS